MSEREKGPQPPILKRRGANGSAPGEVSIRERLGRWLLPHNEGICLKCRKDHPFRYDLEDMKRPGEKGWRPLEFTYDPYRDVLKIEGVEYTGSYFRMMARPNLDDLVRIEREGDQVILTRWRGVTERPDVK